MISEVVLLSLLTFVCSQTYQVPYVQSIAAIENATKELQSQVMSMEGDIPSITDFRRHYAVLVTHLGRVSYFLTERGTYYPDISIEELPNSIVLGLMKVDEIIGTVKSFLDKIDDQTQKIRTLVAALCNEEVNSQVCNQIVDQAVKGDPERYRKEAALMLQAGYVANKYLDANFVTIAREYNEHAYMINHSAEIHDLIFGLSKLIKNTYKNNNDINEM